MYKKKKENKKKCEEDWGKKKIYSIIFEIQFLKIMFSAFGLNT